MSNLALRRLVDGASGVLIFVFAAAFALIAMWPVDDSAALRMDDSAWQEEACRRFFFLAFCSLGGGVLVLFGHLALFRLTSAGSVKRAGRWALFSIVVLLLVAMVATWRFLVVRPWF